MTGERTARYVFSADLRLVPASDGIIIEPSTVERTLFRDAAAPGEDGWLFFRDECWRGELNHPDHVASILADEVGLPVTAVSFSELRTTRGHLEDLRSEIAADLGAFNADTVDEVLSKYLGSSIHVVDRKEL